MDSFSFLLDLLGNTSGFSCVFIVTFSTSSLNVFSIWFIMRSSREIIGCKAHAYMHAHSLTLTVISAAHLISLFLDLWVESEILRRDLHKHLKTCEMIKLYLESNRPHRQCGTTARQKCP